MIDRTFGRNAFSGTGMEAAIMGTFVQFSKRYQRVRRWISTSMGCYGVLNFGLALVRRDYPKALIRYMIQEDLFERKVIQRQ